MTTTKADLAATLNDVAMTSGLAYVKPGVVVHVRDTADGPAPAPAWYVPSTDDIFIDVDRAEVPEALRLGWVGVPEKVRMRLLGLLAHEAAHSAWSHWLTPGIVKGLPKGEQKAVFDVLTMLEEVRIENRAVAANPRLAAQLRAALPLVIGGLKDKEITSRGQAARGWGLIFGRTLSGIIDDGEVDWMDETARIVLGDNDVDVLVELLSEAVAIPSDQSTRLVEIAREWVEVVGATDEEGDGEGEGGCSHGDPDDESEEEGEGGEAEEGDEAEAESSDESGSGGSTGDPTDDEPDDEAGGGEEEGDEPDDGDESGEATGTDPGGLGDFGSQDGAADTGEPPAQPLDPEAAEAMWEAIKDIVGEVDEHWQPQRGGLDMADPQEMAGKVFGRKTRKGRLTPRDPGVIERGEIATTARILESLALPSITKKTVAAAIPPGRLRNREAIRQSAERAQGMLSTAKPWKATKRRHDDVKPVVVGVMTDVSGSMAWAETAVAEFAYVWGNAAARIAARTASVTFGDRVDAVVRPGEVPGKVQVKSADGGSEVFNEAAAALDGVLKLSVPNGSAKVLLVVSDGHFVISKEADRAYEWCRRFTEGGTKVVWLRPKRGNHALTEKLEKDGLATVVEISGVGGYYGRSGEDEGTVFGKIQAAALTALSQRR